jgi:probable HAF family extracellular repeat protein
MRSLSRARLATLAVATILAGCGGENALTPTEAQPKVASAGTTALAVTATSPSSSARDTTLDVQVSGSGFDRGSQAVFLLDGVADARVRTNSTRYVSQGQLVANLTIALDAVPERYDVMVTTSKGKKGIGTELFTVLTMLDLGLPAGGYNYGRDVNSSGTVVGEYVVPRSTCRRAYVWTEASGAADLPVPAGACISGAVALNDAGTIVGWASVGAGQHAALRWSPGGAGMWSVEQLPAPSGYSGGGDLIAIASDGHLLGAFLRPDLNWDYFVWSPGIGWEPVQVPAGDCWSSGGGINAVNAAGQIVGSDCAGALFWNASGQPPVRLPGLGGPAVGWDMDDAGTTIVGKAKTVTGVGRAVRWTADGAGGWTVEDLGDLGGGEAEARSINAQGEIAGCSATGDGNNPNRAFLWQPLLGMKALGSLTKQSACALAISNGPLGGPRYLSGYSLSTARGAYQRAVRWTE